MKFLAVFTKWLHVNGKMLITKTLMFNIFRRSNRGHLNAILSINTFKLINITSFFFNVKNSIKIEHWYTLYIFPHSIISFFACNIWNPEYKLCIGSEVAVHVLWLSMYGTYNDPNFNLFRSWSRYIESLQKDFSADWGKTQNVKYVYYYWNVLFKYIPATKTALI